jgi:hypothetical protein
MTDEQFKLFMKQLKRIDESLYVLAIAGMTIALLLFFGVVS